MNSGDAAPQQVEVMVSLRTGQWGHTKLCDGGFGDREDTAEIRDDGLGTVGIQSLISRL